MWPLDGGRGKDVLRLGSNSAELWRAEGQSFDIVESQTHARRSSLYDTQPLAATLAALATRSTSRRATVIIESAFLPLMLVDTGGALWSDKQLEALLRHRFGLAYGGTSVNVAPWTFRSDYRFGERFALAFALPPTVKSVLNGALAAGWKFGEWTPAFSWSWSKWRRRSPATGSQWWLCSEQDRTLLAHTTDGRANALHAALPRFSAEKQLMRRVDSEQLRSGVGSAQDPIGAVCWNANELPETTARVRWLTLRTGNESAMQPQSKLGAVAA